MSTRGRGCEKERTWGWTDNREEQGEERKREKRKKRETFTPGSWHRPACLASSMLCPDLHSYHQLWGLRSWWAHLPLFLTPWGPFPKVWANEVLSDHISNQRLHFLWVIPPKTSVWVGGQTDANEGFQARSCWFSSTSQLFPDWLLWGTIF